jgi:hypothetical protein
MKKLADFVAWELNLVKIPVSRIARLLCVPSWDGDRFSQEKVYHFGILFS